MTRHLLTAACLLSLTAGLSTTASAADLSAQQIIDKNVAARGGLSAWRAVQTLHTEGELDAGGAPSHALPYVLKQKRGHKSHLEIAFKGQNSIQVYNGEHGWKVRPFLNRIEVEDYTPAELKIAADADEFDGPLIDYASKGTKVVLAGTDKVEGHPAYKLSLTFKNGARRNVWVDEATFLEVKMDGEPRKLDGKLHTVSVYFHDYKSEHGLVFAHEQQTVVEGTKQSNKLTVTKFAINEPMDDALFQKPKVDAKSVAAPQAAPAAAPAPAAKGP